MRLESELKQDTDHVKKNIDILKESIDVILKIHLTDRLPENRGEN